MSATIQALGLEKLTRDERLQLAEELWESVADEAGTSILTDAHRADLDRRLEEEANDPDPGITWEEYVARRERGKL